MLGYGDRMRRRALDLPGLAAYWIDRVERLLRACVRDRDRSSRRAQAIDVPFDEFMADDVAHGRAHLREGGPADDGDRRAASSTRFMAENPRGKHGQVRLRPAGATSASTRRRCGRRFDFYFERFPVRVDWMVQASRAEPATHRRRAGCRRSTRSATWCAISTRRSRATRSCSGRAQRAETPLRGVLYRGSPDRRAPASSPSAAPATLEMEFIAVEERALAAQRVPGRGPRGHPPRPLPRARLRRDARCAARRGLRADLVHAWASQVGLPASTRAATAC